MKRIRIALVGAAAVALLAVGSAVALDQTFSATLSGAEEVPVRATPATGSASFSFDGVGLSYRVEVQNIRNVVGAHIHLGPRGVNGPIVLTMFMVSPPGVFGGGPGPAAGGLLAAGRTTALEGPLAGQPMSALVAQLEAGNAYVNVHTNDGVVPVDTGPGDFPGGEIRGQVVVGSTGTLPPGGTTPTPPAGGVQPPPPPPGPSGPGDRGRGR